MKTLLWLISLLSALVTILETNKSARQFRELESYTVVSVCYTGQIAVEPFMQQKFKQGSYYLPGSLSITDFGCRKLFFIFTTSYFKPFEVMVNLLPLPFLA